MSDPKFDSIIKQLHDSREKHGVMLGGKLYSLVKDRIEVFRREFGDTYGIDTSVDYNEGFNDGAVVVAIAKITKDGHVLASGYAMETVGSNDYTSTSPIEVAETSAIGRALACFGLHGGEYASGNEVQAKQRDRQRDNDSPASRGPINDPNFRGPNDTNDPDAWRSQERQQYQPNGPRQDYAQTELPMSQRARREPPAALPSGLYVPDLGDEWAPEADQQRILAVIDSIGDVPMLGRYWNELKPYMGALGQDGPDLTAEIKAAFATANNNLGGR